MNRRHLLAAGGIAAATLVISGAQALAAAPTTTGATSTLPTDSVYQLATPLTDQNGRAFSLGDGRGTPTIVSMFYTSCQFVCPMLVEAIRDTQQKLGDDERSRVNVLMVTFDPQHDTVAVLQKTAKQRQLDSTHWTLARAEAPNVRKLASVLGVQYKALPNGDYNHTTALILLDTDGRIVGKTSQLGDADPAFVKLVKATLASSKR